MNQYWILSRSWRIFLTSSKVQLSRKRSNPISLADLVSHSSMISADSLPARSLNVRISFAALVPGQPRNLQPGGSALHVLDSLLYLGELIPDLREAWKDAGGSDGTR